MLRAVAVVLLLTVAGCSAPDAVREVPPAPPRPVAPPPPSITETREQNARVLAASVRFLADCRVRDCGVPVGSGVEADAVRVERDTVVVEFSRDLGDAAIRTDGVADFERRLKDAVGAAYPGSPVRAETRGGPLSALVPEFTRPTVEQDPMRRFAPPVTGPPLTRRDGASPTAGLAGRHIALWPSHGWLYANGGWGWQRPRLFTSVEDLLTVAFVTRELAPMLERAGAVTLLARERDTRAEEVIVADGVISDPRRASPGPPGFGLRASYRDGISPFSLGTSQTFPGGTADYLDAGPGRPTCRRRAPTPST